MRGLISLAAASGLLTCSAQGLLINEVLPSPGARNTGTDRIELYNASDRSIDPNGYTLFIAGASYRIVDRSPLAAHGFMIIDRASDGAHLRLPKHGGTLLLIAHDGRSIDDVFTWPALPAGVSMGRGRDGSKAVRFFQEPTIGHSNSGSAACLSVLAAPEILIEGDHAVINSKAPAMIRFTRDGSTPDATSEPYRAPILCAPGTVITARAFAADAVPSAPASLTVVGAAHSVNALSIRVDPLDLWSPERGICFNGAEANYTRRGKNWQRAAQLGTFTPRGHTERAVGIAISGSGSRAWAKKNYKLFARDRYGDDDPIVLEGLPPQREIMLRADATPGAFLRNVFMERITQRTGNRVDVQPSRAFPFYLNGHFEGLYRAMPAKNAEWLRSLGGSEAVELIDGPGDHAVHGKAAHFRSALDRLLRHASIDSIEALIDVQSLIELACFDLYTGRADHELNVRSWRPRVRGGRWRWVLFDMDLWSPPQENSVLRMCSAPTPETPFVSQLLADPVLHDRLLARYCALMATALSPDRGTALADSIAAEHAALIQEDFDRWKDTLALPSPQQDLAALTAHIAMRPARSLEHLAHNTHLTPRAMSVTVDPPNAGNVLVEDLELCSDRAHFTGLAHVPLLFEARPANGMEFVGWKGSDSSDPRISIDPARTSELRALFRPMGTSSKDRLKQ